MLRVILSGGFSSHPSQALRSGHLRESKDDFSISFLPFFVLYRINSLHSSLDEWNNGMLDYRVLIAFCLKRLRFHNIP
jgi:hypothetical protein